MINAISSAVVDSRLKLLLMVPFLVCAFTSAVADDNELGQRQKLTSHLLIKLFLEKVDDEDGLVLFGQYVASSDLEPYEVSHVHNLMDDSLLVRLYFKLRKKVLVPNYENYCVEGITVETDPDGNIIQIMTQVSPLSEDKVD